MKIRFFDFYYYLHYIYVGDNGIDNKTACVNRHNACEEDGDGEEPEAKVL